MWLRRLPKEEIAARVAAFRAKLADTGASKDVPRDEFGRVAWVFLLLSYLSLQFAWITNNIEDLFSYLYIVVPIYLLKLDNFITNIKQIMCLYNW